MKPCPYPRAEPAKLIRDSDGTRRTDATQSRPYPRHPLDSALRTLNSARLRRAPPLAAILGVDVEDVDDVVVTEDFRAQG